MQKRVASYELREKQGNKRLTTKFAKKSKAKIKRQKAKLKA